MTSPQDDKPAGIEPLETFDLLFGDSRPDALIAVGSRRPNKKGEDVPHWLFALRTSDRRRLLPKIFEYEIENTQFVIAQTLGEQALVRGNVEKHRDAILKGDPRYFQAANKHVRELVAIVVDLDVGREDSELTAWDALGVAGNMCDAGLLPWPSLAALSGRGAYLLWLLREQDGRPPLATADNQEVWRRSVAELLERVANLEPDHGSSRHLAHFWKRPGTVDSKTKNRVIYLTFGVDNVANIPRYGLQEIAEFLGVHHTRIEDVASGRERLPSAVPEVQGDPPRRKRIGAGRTRGNPAAPHAKRVREIERICSHRRGRLKGVRHYAIHHFFQSLRIVLLQRNLDLGRPEDSARVLALMRARDEAAKLNRTFTEPLPPEKFDKALQQFTGSARKKFKGEPPYRPRGATLARDLKVKPAEVRKLELEAIIPQKMRAEIEQKKAEARALREATTARMDELIAAGYSDSDIPNMLLAEKFETRSRQAVNLRRRKHHTAKQQQLDLGSANASGSL